MQVEVDSDCLKLMLELLPAYSEMDAVHRDAMLEVAAAVYGAKVYQGIDYGSQPDHSVVTISTPVLKATGNFHDAMKKVNENLNNLNKIWLENPKSSGKTTHLKSVTGIDADGEIFVGIKHESPGYPLRSKIIQFIMMISGYGFEQATKKWDSRKQYIDHTVVLKSKYGIFASAYSAQGMNEYIKQCDVTVTTENGMTKGYFDAKTN